LIRETGGKDVNTWRCVNCGSVIPADDKVCPSCSKNPGVVSSSTIPPTRVETKPLQGPKNTASSFGGKTEAIYLLILGVVSAAAFIASIVDDLSRFLVYLTGVLAAIFALPFALIIVAVVLGGLLQMFTPGGGSAIPLLAWNGGVDGLSPVEKSEFEAKPIMVRVAKVYLWLAVNSLVGAVIMLIAFAALYMLMQVAQQKNH
jgi:hypothetical protein